MIGGTIIEEEQSTEKLSENKPSSSQSLTGVGLGNEGSNAAGDNKDGSKGCCSCCAPLKQKFRPLMQKHNTLPPNPTKKDRVTYALSCPPHGKVTIS